ncbi:MAG TPA: hypothetical protein PLP89_01690 [Synergistales bacterium]|nr:hypothetical protein [Synergistales bacterium]MDY0179243.1 hypothetical protein [Synergistaceae bacterium]HOI80848.1 hypothetical protein [Synergistales bacterium]HPD97013.1 hypothetical protein [Synergistales bacterium]HRV71153.1 hypothetical protein [Thermovirgaceae bacterium]
MGSCKEGDQKATRKREPLAVQEGIRQGALTERSSAREGIERQLFPWPGCCPFPEIPDHGAEDATGEEGDLETVGTSCETCSGRKTPVVARPTAIRPAPQ